MINFEKNRKKGFTLLYATLVGSLLIAIASGIFNIIFKELQLSASSRESQFAFYSADSGLECALYWDIRHSGFGVSIFSTSTASTPPSSGVVCNSQDIAQAWTISERTATEAKTTFSLSLSNAACATVLVHKQGSGVEVG